LLKCTFYRGYAGKSQGFKLFGKLAGGDVKPRAGGKKLFPIFLSGGGLCLVRTFTTYYFGEGWIDRGEIGSAGGSTLGH